MNTKQLHARLLKLEKEHFEELCMSLMHYDILSLYVVGDLAKYQLALRLRMELEHKIESERREENET